jgi:outer membrane receptor protein involved in Fe transport
MQVYRLVRSFLCIATLIAALGMTVQTVDAAGTGSIGGTVVSTANNGPIQGAKVDLSGPGGPFRTQTAKDGSFSFTGLGAGDYVLHVAATLYQTAESAKLALADGQSISLTVALQPATTTNISTLGHVTVRGHAVLNTSSAPTTTVTASDFTNVGALQAQTALENLPGVTLERYNGGAPGNVATLTIRGAGGFGGGSDGTSNTGYEILVLQDGEPMRNGQYGDFDVSSLTPAIYSKVEVVEGVGGTSLFGANTVGGTVNFVTRDPASTEGGQFLLTAGGFGTTDWNVLETNTLDKFGYLIDLHRYGTNGFVPSPYTVVFQPFSGASVIDNPNQIMNLNSGLFKLRYNFSNTSNLVLDSSLESDYRNQVGLVANPNTTSNGTPIIDPTTGLPSFYGFPGDYVWNIQPKYAANFTTSLGGGALVLRYYQQYLERVVDGLNESPQTCCYLSRSTDRLIGELVQWTKPFNNNTLTLAIGGNSDNFYYGLLPGFSSATFAQLVPNAQGSQIERTYLARDDWQASSQLDITLAAYYSDYDTLLVKRLDPRIAAVYKPDANSVIRASFGTGFAPPRLSDLFSTLNLGAQSGIPGSGCPGSNFYCVATVGNPALKAETATGGDIGYQRVFSNDGNVNIDFYHTYLTNHIFDGIVPAPAGLFFQGNNCSGAPCPVLFLSQPINLAHAVYQGIEFNGTLPVTQNFGIQAMYNVQSAFPQGVDALTQAELGNVVNNQQFMGVPLQKLGWSIQFHNDPHSATAFFGANYYGHNNAYNVNPFWQYNAGAQVPFGADTLHIAWTNIFNTNAGVWGQYNLGVPLIGAPGYTLGCHYPSAPYLYCTTAYPAPPHQLMVTYEHRWGSLR